jgi:hypothetical protein
MVSFVNFKNQNHVNPILFYQIGLIFLIIQCGHGHSKIEEFYRVYMNKCKNKNKQMARQSLRDFSQLVDPGLTVYVSKSKIFPTPHIGHLRHGLIFTRLDC